LLNAKYNNYVLLLPKDWLYPSIINKYKYHLQSELIPFPDVISFINSTIQSVSFPAMGLDIVKQVKKNSTPSYRSGYEANRGYTTEMTLTFRVTEGYINYFILKDQLERYYDTQKADEKNRVFVPDLMLYFMDKSGRSVLSLEYKNIVFFGISELELSYSTNTPEFKTFDIQLAYETLEFKSRYD